MSNDFDFDKIGKRMPYRVPEQFFDSMETNVLEIVGKEKSGDNTGTRQGTVPKPHTRKRMFICSVVAAAAAALLFVVIFSHTRQDAPTLNDVDRAFCQLSAADQQYMLSVYQDDEFINH